MDVPADPSLCRAHKPFLPVLIEPRHEKTCLCHVNNKGADQPVHPGSLISTFVVHCLDSIISVVSILAISCLQLASAVEQTGLSLTCSKTVKTGFFVTRLLSCSGSFCNFSETYCGLAQEFFCHVFQAKSDEEV